MTRFSSMFRQHDEKVLGDACTTYFLELRTNMSGTNEPMSDCRKPDLINKLL
jgi:hypothetical protein